MSIDKIKIRIVLFSAFFYLSLITGFYFNESLNGGAYGDWVSSSAVIKDFSKSFFETLINYDNYGHRHSPVYLIFLSLFLKLDFSLDLIRLIHLHFSILLIFIFYKCLELKFEKFESTLLILLVSLIFFSPTFRSLSIWPDTRIPGLLFFTTSIYFFLKYEKTQSEKFLWLTSSFLILSSYISPNFSLFFLFFFAKIFKQINFPRLLLFFLFNTLWALPFLFYLFVMDVNFLSSAQTPSSSNQIASLNFNFANKILIISSIIFFHLIPILIFKNHFINFLVFIKNKIILILLIFIPSILFFNYEMGYTGGGIFFHFSNHIFENNNFFYVISLISLSFLLYLCNLDVRNLYFFFILILTNIQNTIYHKYYEPLLIIIFFTILKNVNEDLIIRDKKITYSFYAVSIFFIATKIYKNYYLI